jgi:imidazolonepropionase-like amidohydrolase
MVAVEDVLDPRDEAIYRALAGGVTTVHTMHGSANAIGGTNAVIKLRWGADADGLLFRGAPPTIKFALGENPKRANSGPGAGAAPRYPATRMGVVDVIRQAFVDAQAYKRAWDDYRGLVAGGDATAIAPRKDLKLEPLVEILEGKRLVHAHCYRADEILMLIRLAEEMGFKIATFQHVLEGYKVAKEIAAHGAGASTFSDWWAYKVEAEDAIPHNAAIMTRKGVLVSINSDSAEHARRLNTEAAKTIKWGGLSEDEALALVTINPAKQLRIDTRVGSLEVGKDADLAVWTHHPLSSYAIVDRTYIDGTVYYDRLSEERRLTELRKEKSALAAAERGTPTRTADPQDQPDAEAGAPAGGGGPSAPENGQQPTAAGTAGRSTAAQSPAGAPTVMAITNATIHPVTGATLERGTVVIRGGKIEAVGTSVQAPAGAKVIDAAGAHVYPGFINAATTMGLDEPGPRGFADATEMLDMNPYLRSHVAYNFASDAIPVARVNGITTVALEPGGGIFGGQMAVVNLDGWTWEEALVKPNVGIVFNFPTIGGGGGRGGFGGRGGRGQAADRPFEDLKRERDRRLDRINRLFDQARAYARAGADRAVDWTLDALVPVVEGKLPLITSVSRAQDIRDAIAFAEKARVKIVISGGSEAAAVAPLLKEKNVPVILGGILGLPQGEDLFHADSYQLAGRLAQAGVKVAFSTGDYSNVRLLPYHAAMSVAWGMDRDQAIRALTIDAAEILGIGDRVGSIEPGKDANLFIAKGDPLEIRTEISHVIIGGRDVGLDNKHEALYRTYIARP